MADFGKRNDGTNKGNGYFGVVKRPDGAVSTELSIGVDMGNGEEEIPTMVPMLNKKELDHLINGGEPTKEIVDKAVKFAIYRKRAGLPVFATPEEEGSYKLPKD
jgi:hypothetical protein